MKIRIFRVLGIVVISLSTMAFKNQLEDKGFKLAEGHISYVNEGAREDLVIEESQPLEEVCSRVNKKLERQVDYCDPVYFEEMVLEVCKKEALGGAVEEGRISGPYRKPWYSMVDVDKDWIDKFGSEPEKRAAEEIIDLKKNGAKHVFDFTISFKCT